MSTLDGKCLWKQDDDGNWKTGCGEMFVFFEGTPAENKMRYCHYCGKELKEEKYTGYLT